MSIQLGSPVLATSEEGYPLIDENGNIFHRLKVNFYPKSSHSSVLIGEDDVIRFKPLTQSQKDKVPVGFQGKIEYNTTLEFSEDRQIDSISGRLGRKIPIGIVWREDDKSLRLTLSMHCNTGYPIRLTDDMLFFFYPLTEEYRASMLDVSPAQKKQALWVAYIADKTPERT